MWPCSGLLLPFFSGCGMRGSFSGPAFPVTGKPHIMVSCMARWQRLGSMVTLTMPAFELLGLGLILAALYLQGKIEREKVWKDEGTLERFLGSVPRAAGE